jgi:phosphoribosylformimino-5-aminoimidazole carboxamide ribotide isomerase
MQIVPAIDVKDSKVVRAVAGERMAYLPVRSVLCEQSSPEAVGAAMVDSLGLTQGYLADLDAIEGAEPDWELYLKLIDCGLTLWIDAGLTSVSDCEQMAEFARSHPEVNGIIAGMESIPDCETFERYLAILGPEQLIFGLDLKDGRPLTRDSDWQKRIALDIAIEVTTAGVARLIVIDLARIGMHGGCGTQTLCKNLHERFPKLSIYAGGGIRSRGDLRDLKGWGCGAALISSALHDGWITREDIDQLQTTEKTS